MGELVLAGRPLTRGRKTGEVLRSEVPLSFWGGVGADGVVVDAHHPLRGRSLAGRVLVMVSGRGSSSSSSVLAELLRTGKGPVAIVLARPDPIIALGAIVADELYSIATPVVVVPEADLALVTGSVTVTSDPDAGTATITLGSPG
jgi:predicted aconitase with swiveling domain